MNLIATRQEESGIGSAIVRPLISTKNDLPIIEAIDQLIKKIADEIEQPQKSDTNQPE